jgi:predicted amidohydrolase YtcJ
MNPKLMGASPSRSDSSSATDTASAPTRVENVHGYTLAGDKLQQFSCLVFALGKVVAVGDTATLRGRYPTATVIDGRGQAQATISAFAKAHPDRPWVLGGGWNQVPWKIGRFPTAAELDAEVADRPAVLERVDGHAKWLNSKALRAAGITRDTPDPSGGRIERDPDGNPSGVLVDKAMDLVDRVTPESARQSSPCIGNSPTSNC